MIVRTITCLAACFFFTSAAAEKSDLTLIGTQGTQHFFTLSEPWISDHKYIEHVSRATCGKKPLCMAHFWKKGTPAAKRLPMTDAEISSELASFQNGKMMWRCGAYKVANSKNCFND